MAHGGRGGCIGHRGADENLRLSFLSIVEIFPWASYEI